MFKFEDYPEILEMHEKDEKLNNKATRISIKIENNGEDEKLKNLFDNSNKECEYFEKNIYAKLIFDTFYKKIPYLINKKTKKKEKWNDVIGNDFDKIPVNRKAELVTIVEGYSLYLFPPEYYNDIDRSEMFRIKATLRDLKKEGIKNPTWEQIRVAYRKDYDRDPQKVPFLPKL